MNFASLLSVSVMPLQREGASFEVVLWLTRGSKSEINPQTHRNHRNLPSNPHPPPPPLLRQHTRKRRYQLQRTLNGGPRSQRAQHWKCLKHDTAASMAEAAPCVGGRTVAYLPIGDGKAKLCVKPSPSSPVLRFETGTPVPTPGQHHPIQGQRSIFGFRRQETATTMGAWRKNNTEQPDEQPRILESHTGI